MTPSIDVRRPIGLLWIVIGGLLAIYGVIPHHEVARSLAVDRWWGCIMVVFGIAMLAATRRVGATHTSPLDPSLPVHHPPHGGVR